MTRFVKQSVLLAGLGVVLSAPLAFSQSSPVLQVNVGFEFTARNKAFPAGVYIFRRDPNSVRSIVMTSADGKLFARLPVVTDIARSSSMDDHLLAFDKLGDQKVLSEIWLPQRDGALVHVTDREHEHEVVRLNKKVEIKKTKLSSVY